MITCTYNKNKGIMCISGHSGYAPIGQDIVCAGVSTLEHTLIENLYNSNCMPIISLGDEDIIYCKDEEAQKMMDFAWVGFVNLAESFPENVSCRWG